MAALSRVATDRRKPLRITRERRKRMEEIVDDLVRLLDEIDGDPDLEPSLETMPGYIVDAEGPDDNGIADEGGLQEQVGGEPSLGWTHQSNQTRKQWLGIPPWGSPIDAEQEHDGREPSLGSLERHPGSFGQSCSQVGWGSSGTTDREPDGDEQHGEHAD